MMAMLESDLQQLEEFLDGGLEPAAVSQLQLRLKNETRLADALGDLKSQRAVRSAAWQSFEPDNTTAERLAWRVRGAMMDQQRQMVIQPAPALSGVWNSWRIASLGSAVAACVMLGFLIGRVGRGAGAASTPDHAGQPAAQIVSNSPGKFVPDAPTARIRVPITDEYGRFVAWQTFDNADQAKTFTEDLSHTRSQPISGQPTLVDKEGPF